MQLNPEVVLVKTGRHGQMMAIHAFVQGFGEPWVRRNQIKPRVPFRPHLEHAIAELPKVTRFEAEGANFPVDQRYVHACSRLENIGAIDRSIV